MNKSIDNNIGSRCDNIYSCESFSKTKLDPAEILPCEIFLHICSYLDLITLARMSWVNRKWRLLALDGKLWKETRIYREAAISNEKWVQWFGPVVVNDEDLQGGTDLLPLNIVKTLLSPCPVFPEKTVIETHMLVWLPRTLNSGLTLNSIGQLAAQFFLGKDSGYRLIKTNILGQLGDKSIEKSRWVLMTRDLVPGSQGKDFDTQQRIIAELAERSGVSYRVPETLEAVVCSFSGFFDSQQNFSRRKEYTFCVENVGFHQTIVGGLLSEGGLHVHSFSYTYNRLGVVAVRDL